MPVEPFCANPACRQRHVVPSAQSGQSAKCQACGQAFVAGGSATIGDAAEPARNGSAPSFTATTASAIGS